MVYKLIMFQLIISIIILLVQTGGRGSDHCEECNMSGFNNQSDDLFCNLSIKHDLLPALITYISSGTVSGIVCVIVVDLPLFDTIYATSL